MHYHLVHIVPNARTHGPNGYKEIIETVSWGLEQLGHQVTYSVGTFNGKATNIIFGAHVLSINTIQFLKEDTIIYNFEQIRGLPIEKVRMEMHTYAKRFRIWEYSPYNCEVWEAIGTKYPIKTVPVGFAPVLNKIEKIEYEDIDILFYGTPAANRLGVFQALSQLGLVSVFVSGLYGGARDALIARSKVVLNVSYVDFAKIFEIARVSYLMANKKAVISLWEPGTEIEPDIRPGLKLSPPQSFIADCLTLVDSAAERKKIEDAGYEVITQRDIREILKKALL